jgi:hypothetical protein
MVPLAGLASAAGAQTPSPAPSPSPVAFAARAHADVTVDMQGRTLTGDAQLGLSMRANLTRVDVLSVKSDAMSLPPITVSLVIDRTAHTIAVWNDVTKLYHVQSLLPSGSASASPKASPSPKASGVPRAAPQAASPFGNLDVFAMTVKLTGHTTTGGLPTTGMSFDLQVAKKGETVPSHVTAAAQLADEYAAFPMSIQISVKPAAAQFQANIAYVVDALSHDVPPLSRFEIPAGYTDAGSLMAVILPSRAAAPAAAAHAH